ncbi:MAG: PqqD family protein [Microthrixaceae bacterium]|nr:PqqD family protein [Microthrixaceae bacterium]MCB1012847.1 PqqD family protein [Microthrixaceae bacterium]MCO5322526.1 PqqD family protein [Microthrixaceae bacterium]
MGSDQRFRIADGVTWDLSEDQVVILDPEGSTMITLNEVGSILWPELDRSGDLATLVEKLRHRFDDVEADQLESDVRDFLDELLAEGLVAPAPV